MRNYNWIYWRKIGGVLWASHFSGSRWFGLRRVLGSGRTLFSPAPGRTWSCSPSRRHSWRRRYRSSQFSAGRRTGQPLSRTRSYRVAFWVCPFPLFPGSYRGVPWFSRGRSRKVIYRGSWYQSSAEIMKILIILLPQAGWVLENRVPGYSGPIYSWSGRRQSLTGTCWGSPCTWNRSSVSSSRCYWILGIWPRVSPKSPYWNSGRPFRPRWGGRCHLVEGNIRL